MGFLPEALRNYLLRLGWGHGDDEIISDDQAAEWFDGTGLGKAPSRFDTAKLTALNAHYLKAADDDRLISLIKAELEGVTGNSLDDTDYSRLKSGMTSLKERAKTLLELTDNAKLYVTPRPLTVDEKALKILDDEARNTLAAARDDLAEFQPWTSEALEDWARDYAEKLGLKLGKLAQPLRAAVTGSTVSPPIFEVMAIFGQEETLRRIEDCAKSN